MYQYVINVISHISQTGKYWTTIILNCQIHLISNRPLYQLDKSAVPHILMIRFSRLIKFFVKWGITLGLIQVKIRV